MGFISSIKNFLKSLTGSEKKPKIVIREIDAKNNPKSSRPAYKQGSRPESGKDKTAVKQKNIKSAPRGGKEFTPKTEGDESTRAPKPAAVKAPKEVLPADAAATQTTGKKSGQRSRKKSTPEKKAGNAPKNTGPLIEDFVPEEWDYTPHMPPETENKTRFNDLNLSTCILRGVHDIGFSYCTDIQAEILPHSLKGLDVTGRAQTGTGKTAAFLLTILEHLLGKKPEKQRKHGAPRALIMAPTRELVMQIEKDARELSKYCGARILAIFGGIDYEKQRDALEDDYVDIMIATPGRMLDYYKQKIIRLDRVEILVLDEADRMLDMGFLPDMRRIIDATPPKSERQTMLFSATLTPEIARLASMWTNSPIKVEIEPEQITSADVEQVAYIVTKDEKFLLLYNLLKNLNIRRAIIFANRRDQVRKLTERLEACDFSCGMLTGDVNQAKRIKTLESLRNGKINILIATDVAGRGIHVEGVEAVFNYTLPDDPDDYVHRIGRTGRAGAKGRSISFASEEDSYVLPNIEAHIKEPLKYITPDDELLAPLPEEYEAKIKEMKRKRSAPAKRGKSGGNSAGKRRLPAKRR